MRGRTEAGKVLSGVKFRKRASQTATRHCPPRAPWGLLGAAQARGGRAAEGPGAEATSARPLGGPGGAGLVSVSPEPRF